MKKKPKKQAAPPAKKAAPINPLLPKGQVGNREGFHKPRRRWDRDYTQPPSGWRIENGMLRYIP